MTRTIDSSKMSNHLASRAKDVLKIFILTTENIVIDFRVAVESIPSFSGCDVRYEVDTFILWFEVPRRVGTFILWFDVRYGVDTFILWFEVRCRVDTFIFQSEVLCRLDIFNF